MTKLFAPYLIGAGAFAAIVGAALYLGAKWERDRAELQDARDHIETRDRIDDAITANPGCAWLDRLRGTCE